MPADKTIQPVSRVLGTDDEGRTVIADGTLVTGREAQRHGFSVGVRLALDWTPATGDESGEPVEPDEPDFPTPKS